jgi:hypothetical protein
MVNVNLNCGIINNFFSTTEADELIKIFKKLQSIDETGHSCHGIDKNHLAYTWFKKFFLNKLANTFDPNLRLIFGMMLDCTVPFDIHNDLKPIPEENGKPYLSCLMPYSVNYDTALCNKASTIIFNEIIDPANQPAVDNNISEIHQSLISHVPVERLDYFSVKLIGSWRVGDLIWWDSQLAHVSSNFVSHGYSSKQCIVAHTYVL